MKNLLVLPFLIVLFTSCNLSGVEEKKVLEPENQLIEKKNETPKPDSEKDSLVLEGGIVIKYAAHGTGDSLKKNSVAMLNYSCRLKDGRVFDSNKPVGKPIPFMVGWNMQTKGWDLAFQHLRVGDRVEIYLPAAMARGKEGLKNLVPPNADNWINLEVVELKKPNMVIDGVKLFLFEREPKAQKINLGDELLLDYIAYSESKPRYSSSFDNGAPFNFKLGSNSNLPGLNMALENAYYGDMMWVLIPSRHAFGSKGNVNGVKPNEMVLFDLLISEKEI